jgi:hypothetical protein
LKKPEKREILRKNSGLPLKTSLLEAQNRLFRKNMITTTLVLLAHYPERAKNIEKIVQAFMTGTMIPEKIIIFIDNEEVDISVPKSVQVIYSTEGVSVMARLFASTFAQTSHVMLLDTDLKPKEDTLEKLIEFASTHPKSVLGHEGVTLGSGDNPYTSVKSHASEKPEKCDVLIRSWFVPIQVFASGLRLYWEEALPNKYSDDLIICLANRFINKQDNYILPVEFDEIGEWGRGQCNSGEHYIYRDQVCSHLIKKYR